MTRVRDPRLDFFRGTGMFIIFVAHLPNNGWAQWIPARFGFSDATEIFVFCSGMASAIAFGRVFEERGWATGALRVLHRCWQVYWAQIGVFVAILALLSAVDRASGGSYYIDDLSLTAFFEHTGAAMTGLVTLTYVPNYFDILPMYLVILALLPLVVALARLSPAVAIGGVLACWAVAWTGRLDLPAEPWSERSWFFNPFSWQIVFFAGFAFMRGWIPAPPVRRDLVWAAAAITVLSVPFAWHRGFFYVPVLGEWNAWLEPVIDKTHVGPLRFLHFLAIAYLAWLAAGPRGARLRGWAVDIVRRVGQQSLAVFLAGLVLAQLGGVALDRLGRGDLAVAFVNLAGFAGLLGAAIIAEWFKSPPWRQPPRPARHVELPGAAAAH